MWRCLEKEGAAKCSGSEPPGKGMLVCSCHSRVSYGKRNPGSDAAGL